MSIYHDYPIPAGSDKAHCSVFGCSNQATVVVVIDMPHRFLFRLKEWGSGGKRMVDTAPATATIGLCRTCAREMAKEEG